MRWAALFDDLEAQARQYERAERAGEVEERTRGEVGALELWDRARAALDTPVAVRLTGGVVVAGVLARAGPDWWLIDAGDGREVLLATAHVSSASGLGRQAAVPGSAGTVDARTRLRLLLRGIARDRSTVRVELSDGSALAGTFDRIGADFVDLAAHPVGEARRRPEVREMRLIRVAAIVTVRRSV